MQPEPPFVDTDEPDINPAPGILPDSPEWPTFDRAAELIQRKAALNGELDSINDELERLTPLVLNYFLQRGLMEEGVVVHGYRLYSQRQLWARPKVPGATKEVCAAMKASGWGHFVHDTYNANTVSAHIRDLERNHADEIADGQIPDVSAVLPPALAAVLNVAPTIKLRGCASTKGKKE